jgi:O-antigen/teichoic acid export membrane protein
VGLLIVVFGNWLILLYGTEYLPAYPALLVLLLGFGAANTLFWNRSLHLAQGRPGYPFQVMLGAGALKVLLTVLLVPTYGYVMQAALLSGYFIVSVGLIAWQGVRNIKRDGELAK